ncbi:PTS system mannose/fructose/sorbose family transporter subunit IID [Holdemania filiformis]|uniref:PTS system mannose/fructose/sorbose family transporter subunit IID n=1 Tax=Holdemania filiformis TaxID=61171 RepID=UPI00242E22FD|nr:PTS system mannose/fructose/sorbose family transporter subunit IID [Holdemania filiformis]
MLLKAFLVSIVVWIGFLDKAFLSTFIYRPICLGPIVGLIFNNLPMGLEVGVTIELMFLAVVYVGTAVPPDEVISAGIATALACLSGSAALGITTAIPISLLGLIGRQFRNATLQELTTRQVEKAAKKADVRGIKIWTSLMPAIVNYILFGLPTFIAVYFGAEVVQNFLNVIPGWLTTGVRAGGGMLGAVGVALLLGTIKNKSSWPYFVLGFIIAAYLGINMIGMAAIALVCVALNYYVEKEETPQTVQSPSREKVVSSHLSKKTLWKTYMYSLAIESGCSNTKQEAPGIVQGLIPVIEEVYTDPKEKAEAYQRHTQLFLTEGRMASFCIGISAAMEERNAREHDIDPESINQIKVALMGPLAGIGDSLIHGTLRPIMAGLGCSMIMASNYTSPAGSIVFVTVMTVVQLLVRYFGIFKGYLGGLNLVARLQIGGILDKITKYAGIAASLICGGFISSLVSINLAIQFAAGDDVIHLQEVLDGLMPNLLPLLLTLLMVWLMGKKKMNMIVLMIAVFLLGIVGVATGILA